MTATPLPETPEPQGAITGWAAELKRREESNVVECPVCKTRFLKHPSAPPQCQHCIKEAP